MFKITGSLLVICSTVFIFSQKTLKYYFTYKFTQNTADIIRKIKHENSSNLIYKKVFENINFDKDVFLSQAKANSYVATIEIKTAENFFDGLGKRDKSSEREYIEYNLKKFERISQDYFANYSEIKKTHFMCGVATGLFIIIYLI